MPTKKRTHHVVHRLNWRKAGPVSIRLPGTMRRSAFPDAGRQVQSSLAQDDPFAINPPS